MSIIQGQRKDEGTGPCVKNGMGIRLFLSLILFPHFYAFSFSSQPPYLSSFFSLYDSVCSIAYLFLCLSFTLSVFSAVLSCSFPGLFSLILYVLHIFSLKQNGIVFFLIWYSFSSNLFWLKNFLLPLNDFFIHLPSYSLGLPPSPPPLYLAFWLISPSLFWYSTIFSFHSCTLPPPTSVPLSFLSFSTFTCLLCLQLITPRFPLLTPVYLLSPSPLLLLHLQVRLLYCSLEEAELVFRAAWAAGQAGPSHMWFAVGPALSGLGLEGLPKVLFAIRPQGWRDEPRR